MLRTRLLLRTGLLVLFGAAVAGIALASHDDPTISHFCATPGGNAKWVSDPADCGRNETVVDVGASAAVSGLLSRIDALEARVDALQTLLTCVSRPIPETLLLTGCNLHIVNGLGTTASVNGLGNIIIGYNPDRLETGSHNLVVGDGHSYTSHSGIVTGANNALHSPRSFVGGGEGNAAVAEDSFVAGGRSNTAEGPSSFVGGGESNTASGGSSFAGGGQGNSASGLGSFAGGGNLNDASGFISFIAGGTGNVASGQNSFVGGGLRNTASGAESFVGGSSDQTAGPDSCGIVFNLTGGIC